MPLYEYQCKQCDYSFEAIQKFSDSPLDKCPECKGEIEKNISGSSFRLKGGGWSKPDLHSEVKISKGK